MTKQAMHPHDIAEERKIYWLTGGIGHEMTVAIFSGENQSTQACLLQVINFVQWLLDVPAERRKKLPFFACRFGGVIIVGMGKEDVSEPIASYTSAQSASISHDTAHRPIVCKKRQ